VSPTSSSTRFWPRKFVAVIAAVASLPTGPLPSSSSRSATTRSASSTRTFALPAVTPPMTTGDPFLRPLALVRYSRTR
jgi:hypothetical protein